MLKFIQVLHPGLACIAGGILGVWNKFMVVEPLIVSMEAARNTSVLLSILLTASPLAFSGYVDFVPRTYKNNTASYTSCPSRTGIWRC